MFDFKDSFINKVLNPLKISKNSIIEFDVGILDETGIYRFKKIIEMKIGQKSYSRYLIFSKSENTEYIVEVFPGEGQELETYLYSLVDTVPFSEDFLEVVGQKFMTTPEGDEFQRCIMSDNEDRIEGVTGHIRVYDIEADKVEREVDIKVWDYQRETEGMTEFMNVEMMEDTGIFRIFKGEIIESIFYKVYQAQ